MGISTLLDVVIGLAFIFTIFSLLASGAYEVGARALATRSKHLWSALHDLLDGGPTAMNAWGRAKGVVSGDQRPTVGSGGDRWTDRLYENPLVRKLDDTLTFEKARLSHIDAEDFSRAILDEVWKKATEAADAPPADIGEAIAIVKNLPGASPFLDDLQIIARQLGNDVDRVKTEVSRWFDSRMDAVSKAYRKNSRWWLFIIGLLVAGVFNVDAINATAELYNDEALRQAVATQAAAVVAECQSTDDSDAKAPVSDPGVIECIDTEVGKVANALSLPVGHEGGFKITGLGLLGWIVAAAALAQGAPFWFDTLSRLSGLKKSLG